MVAKKKVAKKKTSSRKTSSAPVEKTVFCASQEVSSRPRKTNYRFALGVLAVFFVVCAAIFFFVNRPEPDYSYNNFPFTKSFCPGTERTCYYAELNIREVPYSVLFYYHPTEVEDVLFDYSALEALRSITKYDSPKVIIGVPNNSPGELGIAGSQLGRVLGTRHGIMNFEVVPMVVGTGPEQADCDDARDDTVVIAYQNANTDAVVLIAPNCIVLSSSSPQRAVAVSDAFVYRIFGIISTTKETRNDVVVNTDEVFAYADE